MRKEKYKQLQIHVRYANKNKKGQYTMSGVYSEIVDDMRSEAKSIKNVEHINIATFTRVINLYFKYWFEAIIDQNVVMKLYNKMGYLFVIKTACIRYIPTIVYFVKENGKRVRKTKRAETRNGMFPFMFWDTNKRNRAYKFVPSPKWKKKIYKNFFDELHNYPEMSLDDYGRRGSSTYIQHLK